MIVEIDGEVQKSVSRFDQWCTYWRMSYFLIGQLDNKEHVAVFRLLSDPFDKAAILNRGGLIMKDPNEYKENNWYIGKIILDGVLLD